MPRNKEAPVNPRPVVVVVWDDAFYDDEVHTESNLKDNGASSCRLYSAGFLVHETDDHVIISMDFGEDTSCRHVCRIRKENIRKMQIIAE